MSGTGVPVVFIHGLWLHSTSWQPWADRGRLLIISGEKDRTVPDSVSRAAYKLYGRSAAVTEFRRFPDRGHTLTVDSGWTEVAQTALDWLEKQGISGHTALP
jgi:non-heme chloroperoxidase